MRKDNILYTLMLVSIMAVSLVSCSKETNGNNASNTLDGTSWTDGRGVTASFQSTTVWISTEYGAKKNKYTYQYNASNLSLHPISGDGMLVDLTGTVENDVMYIHNPTITYGSTLIYTLYKE